MEDVKMVMNSEDREQFWQTLCSLNGMDINDDAQKLQKTIKLPKYLFRFRPVTINSLEALRTNKLFLSTSNYYDDPFDTFLRIDLCEVEGVINSYLFDEEKLNFCIEQFKEMFGDKLNNHLGIDTLEDFNVTSVKQFLKSGVTSLFLSELSNLRHEIKKDTWSACFSEDGYNESLWLKYAEQHKGFAVMYDTEAIAEKLLCGKLEKCRDCEISKEGVAIYPIYYSDEKYDATRFGQYTMLKKIESLVPSPDVLATIYETLGSMYWEKYKTTLIKKKCHEYDKEWRIIAGAKFERYAVMEWIPSAIILGLNMENNQENLAVSSAMQAGIDKIYKAYINESGELDYRLISK